MGKEWIPEQPKNKSTKELLYLILRSLDEESGFIGDLTFADAIFVDDWLTERGFDSRIENETDNFGGDLQRPDHKCVHFKTRKCICTTKMMAKSFKGGVDSLLGGGSKTTAKRGRPKTNFKVVEKESERGTKENETRATFIVKKDQLEKIKAVAHYDRSSIKEVLDQALTDFLKGRKDMKQAIETFKKKKV